MGGTNGVPLAGVAGVALNITAYGPTAGGYLRAWPTGDPIAWGAAIADRPDASWRTTLVVVRPGAGGKVTIGNNSSGSTDLLVDLVGWFATPTPANTAVELLPPELVRANGAVLRWTRYSGAAPFDRYQVHRSATPGFTPSGSTLLTSIGDQDSTRWNDTTAATSTATVARTYYYKVLVNTVTSNELAVTTTQANTAKVALQPDGATGKATYLAQDRTTPPGCYDWNNYGAAERLRVGTAASGVVHRPLLAFDLRDIPAKAVVSAATLTLSYAANSAPTNLAKRGIMLHRVTRAWTEGRGQYPGVCDGSGAGWSETQGGVHWSAGGGDLDATADASVAPKLRGTASADSFTVTSLVQEWVNATAPNHGVLLKLDDDATIPTDNPYFDYYGDDAAVGWLLPKLTVTFADDSVSVAPRVALAAPAPGATVSGTTVALRAAAGDDGRITQVDFLVDGVVKASDTTAPSFEAAWDSTTATKGAHTITVRASDDAGNVSTTPTGVQVTVDNTAPPTGQMTAPAAGAVVSGTAVGLSASASGTGDAVRQVEFLVDGDRVGAPDTTSPYSVAWNTLAPLQPAFDGAHQVQAQVTETSGQQLRTPATTVTVDNRTTSQYKAKFQLNVTNTDPSDDGVVPQGCRTTPPPPRCRTPTRAPSTRMGPVVAAAAGRCPARRPTPPGRRWPRPPARRPRRPPPRPAARPMPTVPR